MPEQVSSMCVGAERVMLHQDGALVKRFDCHLFISGGNLCV